MTISTNEGHSLEARLVRFKGVNDFEHVGLLWTCRPQSDKIVIHCHGNYGNFYQNSFIEIFAQNYLSSGISFLSFNFRAHDGISEGYFGEDMEYVGGAINSIKSCVADLSAAVSFCKTCEFKTIILQGHSLGCEKIIAFSSTVDFQFPLILLAPVNSKLTQQVWCRERLSSTISEQILHLKEIRGNPLLTGQYGSPSEDADWDYDIPIFKDSLLSLLEGEEVRLFDPEESSLDIIEESLIVLCSADHFNFGRYESHKEFFQQRSGANTKLVELNSKHDFEGVELEVASLCADWCTLQ